MRIQHNIMAMNAYRNYNLNNKALSGNLEKLSSGYKINRAGDDAAGLAISEKMRAQITGLNAAQKNVKDGISLVKTAEGAMQEIQDMLNRMDYLATQSANGTYQDEVDREALQQEVDALRTEINRIADSANFNGIKLLDGSLDDTTKKTINATEFIDSQPAVRHTKDTYKDVQGNKLQLHKADTGAAKTSFELDFSNYEVKGALDDDDAAQEVTFTMTLGKGTVAPDDYTDPTPDGKGKLTANITADKDGNISGKDIVKALADSATGGKVMLTAKDGTEIEYAVTADGNKLKFEMTDKGYKAAAKAYDSVPTEAASDVFNGNFDFGVTATTPATKNFDAAADVITAGGYTTDADGNTDAVAGDIVDGATLYDANGNEVSVAVDGNGKVTISGNEDATQWGLTDLSSSNIHVGSAAAGTQLADGFTGALSAGSFKDGAGFKFGNTSYVFAGTDETLNADYDSNVKLVDIRDLYDKTSDGLKSNGLVADAMSRLTEAAADNDMWSIQASYDDTNGLVRINYRELESYNGDGKDGRADLTTKEGIQEQVRFFTGSKASATVTEAKGTALNLQIGDTSDAFNQMKISVGDMHTNAMGTDGGKSIADISIGTSEDAQAAVNVIKDAINYVSSVRGQLGAYQNRLDHTANNLSVMAENIQDAESTIRDTDVAEEMMSYVKNNILVQSAQAMLAQANQVPQGVLQLLG